MSRAAGLLTGNPLMFCDLERFNIISEQQIRTISEQIHNCNPLRKTGLGIRITSRVLGKFRSCYTLPISRMLTVNASFKMYSVRRSSRDGMYQRDSTKRVGESTAWYSSFRQFRAAYLNYLKGNDWCLSPEQSIALDTENMTEPKQSCRRSFLR